MRAKVSLSLALASDPPLLILDEPTSGLDVMVRREFLESMVDLASTGRTVLLSSHQIGEVERVASHVALLHQGKLILAEPLDELKATDVPAVARRSPAATIPRRRREPGRRADRRGRRPAAGPLAGPRRDRAACEAVRALPGVESVQIETPSLEEIYIGYMRGRRPAASRRRPRRRTWPDGAFAPASVSVLGGRFPWSRDCGGRMPGSSGRSGLLVAAAALAVQVLAASLWVC